MDLEHEPQIYYLKYIKSQDNDTHTYPNPNGTKTLSSSLPEEGFKPGREPYSIPWSIWITGFIFLRAITMGRNWQLVDTPLIPGDESKVVELSDGSWMVNSRLNRKGYRQTYISSDEGKTWTFRPDQSLVDPGCNAGIIRYSPKKPTSKKGILLFVNAKHKTDRDWV